MKATKFKPSEVGPVPVDWEVKRLGEVGEPLMCKRVLKCQTTDSGDIPFYKIGTFGKIADTYISRTLFELFRKQYSYPKKGDILLSAAGTIGRTVVFDGEDAYFQDSNIVWVDNDESIVRNDYLHWYYKVINWQTEDGGIVSRLYNNNLRNSCIAIPPLPEQKAIAEALSDVDALLAAMTKLIEKKRAIKQGAMQHLLTGKKRLAGFSGKWVEKRLGDCALIKARIGWQGLTTAEYLKNGPYYLITGSDFKDGRINWSQCYFVDKARYDQDKYIQIKKDDVLVSKDGTIGKVAFLDDVPGEGTLNSGVFVIRSTDKMIDQPYLAWVFLSRWFDDFIDRLVAGSTIVHLYQKDIVGFEFPVPPTIAEQKAIVAVLSDMDAEIASLESKRAKYESIKQGMMQELLTGKTRLV